MLQATSVHVLHNARKTISTPQGQDRKNVGPKKKTTGQELSRSRATFPSIHEAHVGLESGEPISDGLRVGESQSLRQLLLQCR